MKYIIKPSQLRLGVQIFKRGFKYTSLVTYFTKDGKLDRKEYYTTYTKYGVKSRLVDLLDEAFFEGIRSSEIEVTNFTNINLDLGLIRIHNLIRK